LLLLLLLGTWCYLLLVVVVVVVLLLLLLLFSGGINTCVPVRNLPGFGCCPPEDIPQPFGVLLVG
jgi:hypothetical protein